MKQKKKTHPPSNPPPQGFSASVLQEYVDSLSLRADAAAAAAASAMASVATNAPVPLPPLTAAKLASLGELLAQGGACGLAAAAAEAQAAATALDGAKTRAAAASAAAAADAAAAAVCAAADAGDAEGALVALTVVESGPGGGAAVAAELRPRVEGAIASALATGVTDPPSASDDGDTAGLAVSPSAASALAAAVALADKDAGGEVDAATHPAVTTLADTLARRLLLPLVRAGDAAILVLEAGPHAFAWRPVDGAADGRGAAGVSPEAAAAAATSWITTAVARGSPRLTAALGATAWPPTAAAMVELRLAPAAEARRARGGDGGAFDAAASAAARLEAAAEAAGFAPTARADGGGRLTAYAASVVDRELASLRLDVVSAARRLLTRGSALTASSATPPPKIVGAPLPRPSDDASDWRLTAGRGGAGEGGSGGGGAGARAVGLGAARRGAPRHARRVGGLPRRRHRRSPGHRRFGPGRRLPPRRRPSPGPGRGGRGGAGGGGTPRGAPR